MGMNENIDLFTRKFTLSETPTTKETFRWTVPKFG